MEATAEAWVHRWEKVEEAMAVVVMEAAAWEPTTIINLMEATIPQHMDMGEGALVLVDFEGHVSPIITSLHWTSIPSSCLQEAHVLAAFE